MHTEFVSFVELCGIPLVLDWLAEYCDNKSQWFIPYDKTKAKKWERSASTLKKVSGQLRSIWKE